MKEEKVEFYSEGQKVHGILHVPDRTTDKAIIMVHGFGGYAFNEPFEDVAKNLCDNGLNVLRFAFRGYNGNDNLSNLTISGEIKDLKSAIDLMQERKIIKIGLLTESLGGGIALLLNDSRIKAMVMMAPSFYVKSVLSISKHKSKTGERFWKEVEKINKIDVSIIKATKCPIMIIQGSKDVNVNPEHSKELYNLLAVPKEFVLIENGKHVLTRYPESRKRIIQLSLDWFNKWLK